MLMTETRWYAIQTTAGHENTVRSLIQRKIEQDARPQPDRPIRQALVPTEQVVEIQKGKKQFADSMLLRLPEGEGDAGGQDMEDDVTRREDSGA